MLRFWKKAGVCPPPRKRSWRIPTRFACAPQDHAGRDWRRKAFCSWTNDTSYPEKLQTFSRIAAGDVRGKRWGGASLPFNIRRLGRSAEAHPRGRRPSWPEILEAVAICDHPVALGTAELEDKIGAKRPELPLICWFSRWLGTVERGGALRQRFL